MNNGVARIKNDLVNNSEIADKEMNKFIQEYPDLQYWQIKFVGYVMLPKGLRPSKASIMGELGMTSRQYHYWLTHPVVIRMKQILTKRYFQDDIPDILMAMRDEALTGNVKAAELILSYVDDWRKNEQDTLKLPAGVILSKEEITIKLTNFRAKKL